MTDVNYDTAMLGSPDALEYLFPRSYVVLVSFGIVWVLFYAVVTTVTVRVLEKNQGHIFKASLRGGGDLNESHLFKVASWGLDCVMDIVCLATFFAFVPKSVIFQGTLHQALYYGKPDTDWSQPVAWLSSVADCTWFFGFGVLPLQMGLLFHLCQFGQQKARPMLLVHHLVCLATFMFISYAILSTLNGLWFQMGMIFALHLALEFPINAALVCYRVALSFTDKLWLIVIPYEVLMRIVFWTASVLNYTNLCHRAATYTHFERTWRWMFPIILAVQVTLEAFTIWIHVQLYRRSTTAAATNHLHESTADESLPTSSIHGIDSVTKSEVEEGWKTETFQTTTEECSTPRGHPKTKTNTEWSSSHLIEMIAVALSACLFVVFSNTFVLPISERSEARAQRSPVRVAIVGGGIAGMGAAFAFKGAHSSEFQVDLFETSAQLGGAARTFYWDEPFQPPFIEHAFAAFRDYYNFQQLLQRFGVGYSKTTSTFTVQYETAVSFSNNFTFNNTGEVLGSALPKSENRRNRIFKYRDEIERLSLELDSALEEWNERRFMETTLGEVLQNYTVDFQRDYLTPCLQAYVATGAGLFDIPLALFVSFEKRYRLCLSTARVDAYMVDNGSSAYVEQLKTMLLDDTTPNSVRVILNTSVVAAKMRGGRREAASLMDQTGTWQYDHIIWAIKRHQVYDILEHENSSVCDVDGIGAAKACARLYKQLITPLRAQAGRYLLSVMHNETAYTSSLLENLASSDGCNNAEIYNVVMRNTKDGPNSDLYFNRFDGRLDPLVCNGQLDPPYHIAIDKKSFDANALAELGIDESSILESAEWYHGAHNAEFFKLGRSSHAIQGLGSFWFAGCDFTINFHEEAFVSGLVVAQRLGADYPFVDNPLAEALFLRMRAWMLYGLNPILPASIPRGDS